MENWKNLYLAHSFVFCELILGFCSAAGWLCGWDQRVDSIDRFSRSTVHFWFDASVSLDIIERSRGLGGRHVRENRFSLEIKVNSAIARCFLHCSWKQVPTRNAGARDIQRSTLFSSWKVVESAPLIRMHIPTSRNCRTRNAGTIISLRLN